MSQTVVITGAAGKVGRLLRQRLARPGRTLRLVDIVPPEPAAPDEDAEVFTGTVTDLSALESLVSGADAVIHLGGQSRESHFADVLENNAHGTYCLFEAVRRAGVGRVIFASSNHAAGFLDRVDAPPEGFPADAPGRPDTLYGWSKVAGEAMASLYADRYGIDVLCPRIGMCMPQPIDVRSLALWLSPDDATSMFEACLAVESPGLRYLWGISRNTRRFMSLAEGETLGYIPKDDSEVYADEIERGKPTPDYEHDLVLRRIGGQWCDVPLGEYY
ncbi:NAD(P)-dependent oxidoreductase [Hamadaea sp. NPDC050747]|uniref:NAD-dependent epimerase/dehydratase family protein n=1 Tax=Hamadaea sp. NPDC050747 TaxID=3155789 RepID=UPI0033EFE58F